jgi:phosphoribosylaminoimidazole-succinocarboxamide synthase
MKKSLRLGMRLVRRGKVKDIYELEDGNLLFHFSDRVSAFDVMMATPIPRKGEVLCKFGSFWFEKLDVPHHMVDVIDKDKMVVGRLKMLAVECVVRGYFYGSLVDRYEAFLGSGLPSDFEPILASKLPSPLFDPTTKSEEHDLPISRQDLARKSILSLEEYDLLEKLSVKIYSKMSEIVERAGFIIADVKLEFGKNERGQIILGDSLGPDEFRLWLSKEYAPGKLQDSYDKQLLRDWLTKTGFKQKVDLLAKEGKKPEPPVIAPAIAAELSSRYIRAYELISGRKL